MSAIWSWLQPYKGRLRVFNPPLTLKFYRHSGFNPL
nr:MAG TPA: hypothetical protein [Caudoviricetes sp.]